MLFISSLVFKLEAMPLRKYIWKKFVEKVEQYPEHKLLKTVKSFKL